jgi:hypothetical protein
MIGARPVASVAIALHVCGCLIDASIEGKSCPCADGWVCDALTETCVRSACAPSLRVTALAPAWSTAHDVRWTWEPSGPGEAFLRYELWMAETKEDLAARSGSARSFGPPQTPELGTYAVPVAGDPVTSTVVRGLEAATTYYTQLYVVDVAECAFASEVVARATGPEPQNAITLFGDAILPGAETAPPAPVLQLVPDGGGALLEYAALDDPECNPPDVPIEDVRATCGQPLRVRGFSLDVSEDPDSPTLVRLSNGHFADAYLEVRVQLNSPIPSWFSTVWLANDSCLPFEPPESIFRFDGFTMPNTPEGVTLEIPLGVLEGEAGLLSYADLDMQGSGAPLCGFAVGGLWHKTGVARVDDVKIRF